MIAETIWFALLLTLLGGMLAAAFAPAEWAALRRWWARRRLHRRVRRYAAAWHRDGTDLVFGFAWLAATPARQRLGGGR